MMNALERDISEVLMMVADPRAYKAAVRRAFQELEEKVKPKVEAMARAAVGHSMSVQLRRATRTQSGITKTGTITKCEWKLRRTERCVVASFRITLSCGWTGWVRKVPIRG